ncbi:MAG: phosphoribosyl-AMP cyclohydrolase, partial [Flavobacteriaceae bacterium]
MNLDFNKNKDGLIPAIIQDSTTKNILMLGYMNQEAVDLTISSKKVHFFSRTKNRIWMKGEESGNILILKSFKVDCDKDSI